MPITNDRRFTASGKEIEPAFHIGTPRLGTTRSDGLGIRLRSLDKSFGALRVLKGIDLDVAAGQFVAIVGKSGCGKSTLLRLLTGLDAPDGGSITFTDTAGEVVRPNARIVFQEPRLLPWESVVDNVEVGLSGRRDKGAALAALDEVQLSEKAGEWPSRLSGGQRQRVALARALVSHPDFLALDEPLGALDALTRITMQGLVERVWQEQGFTALFVTHDVGEAVALADRVIVLDEGHIVLDLPIPEPRPRRKGSPATARHEAQLLGAIFGSSAEAA